MVAVTGSSPARRVTSLGEPDQRRNLDPRRPLRGVRGAGVVSSARTGFGPGTARAYRYFRRQRARSGYWRSAQTGRSQLAFARAIRDTDILGMEIGGRGRAASAPVRVAVSTLADHGPTISPDGAKVAFSSGRTGIEHIWVGDADGSNPRQLTFFERGLCATSPSFSPDGKSIAFDATERATATFMLFARTGGMVRLTHRRPPTPTAERSNTGQWIYFMSDRSGSRQIWKARADGSEPTQLTKGGGYQAFESPDGKLVFYAKERGRPGIWSVPVGGGPESRARSRLA